MTSTITKIPIPEKTIAVPPTYFLGVDFQIGKHNTKNWTWMNFSELQAAMVDVLRRFGCEDGPTETLEKIKFESFFPSDQQNFTWIIEYNQVTAYRGATCPAGGVFHGDINECPFDDAPTFRANLQTLYVPGGWARKVLPFAKWGVVALDWENKQCIKWNGSRIELIPAWAAGLSTNVSM